MPSNDFTIILYSVEGDSVSVRADVFIEKLSAVVAGLKKADTITNGRKTSTLVVEDLRYGSASVALREKVNNPDLNRSSGSTLLLEAMNAVCNHPAQTKPKHRILLPFMKRLVSGVDKKFSYAVVYGNTFLKIRVDRFFADQLQVAERGSDKGSNMYFSGIEDGFFDGQIKVIDDRGEMPRGTVILTAGKKEIECVFHRDILDQVKKSFSKRIFIYGRAYYSSDNLLPKRLDIKSFNSIKEDFNLSKWRGAFQLSSEEDLRKDD